MKRYAAIILMALTLLGVSILTIGCRSEPSDAPAQGIQIVTVQRENLVVDITSVGNLAFSHNEELAFETSGTVGEVLMEVGDFVEEGQTLARIDTAEWEEKLEALERSVTTAEDQVTQAERQVTQAEHQVTQTERQVTQTERQVPQTERQVTQAEHQITAKEFALRQAQIDLQTAEYELSAIADVKEAQDAVDDAEYELEFIEMKLKETLVPATLSDAWSFWANQMRLAEARLTEAQQELREILAGSSVKVTTDVSIEVTKKQLQIELTQKQLQDAQIAIEDAQIAVEDAQIAVEDAQIAIEDAQMDVEDAQQKAKDAEIALEDAQKALEDAQQAVVDTQKELDEVKATSTVIRAPFDGLITKLNIATSDTAKKGRAVITIADPDKFETEILVNEIDIFNIREGAQASVQVDAMQGISFPARVSGIASTAIIQSGVVNYQVSVEVESMTPLASLAPPDETEQPRSMPGSIDETLDKAVREDRISREQANRIKERLGQIAGDFSQEQIDQFIERFSQGPASFSQGQRGQFGEGFGQRPGTGQGPGGVTPEAIRLKEGLTVTVSIIVEERNNVLLLPNEAITRQGSETTVQVQKEDITELRSITTGISNWQYTEVTDGLGEGEKVIVSQGTTTSTTQQPRGQFGLFPGGRPR